MGGFGWVVALCDVTQFVSSGFYALASGGMTLYLFSGTVLAWLGSCSCYLVTRILNFFRFSGPG